MKKIGCVKESACRQHFIDRKQLPRLADLDLQTDCGDYLRRIAAED